MVTLWRLRESREKQKATIKKHSPCDFHKKNKCQDRAKGELSIICKVSKETLKANSTLGGRHSLHTEVPKPRDQHSLPAAIPHKHRTFHAETPGTAGTSSLHRGGGSPRRPGKKWTPRYFELLGQHEILPEYPPGCHNSLYSQ